MALVTDKLCLRIFCEEFNVLLPLLGEQFSVRLSALDRDTLLGAAILGIGWGLCRVCPGPAIAGLGAGSWPLLVAAAGIAVGAYVQGWIQDRVPARQD